MTNNGRYSIPFQVYSAYTVRLLSGRFRGRQWYEPCVTQASESVRSFSEIILSRHAPSHKKTCLGIFCCLLLLFVECVQINDACCKRFGKQLAPLNGKKHGALSRTRCSQSRIHCLRDQRNRTFTELAFEGTRVRKHRLDAGR